MSLEQAIQEARRATNRDLIPARLGNGAGTVYDLTTPGNYYLRKLEADGNFSQPFSLPVNPLANIPPVDGLPVSIGYDLRGTQVIWQADNVAMVSANVSPLILNPLDTAVYGKTSQTNLATLFYQRHADTTNFPFTVVVFKAPVIINGVAKFFAGAGVNVSGFVPSAGLHCFVSVFLRTDMTLEAFASTPTNLLNPLTVDTDIADCIAQSSASSIIICAWELRGGDTVLSSDPARNVDMRQIVNTGSSSASNTLTVTDGSTTITDVTSLTFNGADFVVTDLGGGAAQVDAVGGGGGVSVAIYEDQKSANTNGGSSTSATTHTRTLNTEVSDVGNIATLSSNQITITNAGTYLIEWSAPAFKSDQHQTILYDVTNSVNLHFGASSYNANSQTTQTTSDGSYVLVLGASRTISLKHYITTGEATDGLGVAVNTPSGTEVYARVVITKIA